MTNGKSVCSCRLLLLPAVCFLPSAPAVCSCRLLLPSAPAVCSCRLLLPSTPAVYSCRLLLPSAPAVCPCRLLLLSHLARRQAIELAKICAGWQAIIEVALHFPALKMKLPPSATIETSPVGLTLIGKRPAHFPVPTAEQPGHPVCNSAPRRIALPGVCMIFDDSLLRLHFLHLSKVPKNCLHYANAQKGGE